MYRLYIDESGSNTFKSLNTTSPHFVMSFVIVHQNQQESLRVKADQIKYKYWGSNKHVIFRTADMLMRKGSFGIFNSVDETKLDEFYVDFVEFLNKLSFRAGTIVTNKVTHVTKNSTLQNALDELSKNPRSKSWADAVSGHEKKLTSICMQKILLIFLSFLKKKGKPGQIIIESSAPSQDISYFQEYSKFLNGCNQLGMDGRAVREHFTSISFVTKMNHDIESQLSDIVAGFSAMEARHIDGLLPIAENSNYEKVLNGIKQKEFKYEDTAFSVTQNSSFIRLV